MISENSKFKRNEEKFLFSALKDEGVMMNLETGNYTGLNNVAADIWHCLEKPMTITELVDQIKAIYKVDYDQCLADVNEFVEQLQAKEIIQVVS